MILAKQRVTDLNKALAISLLEREENRRKFKLQNKNKKANAIRQRGGNVVNVNAFHYFDFNDAGQIHIAGDYFDATGVMAAAMKTSEE